MANAKQFFNTEEGFQALKTELDFLRNTRRAEIKEDLALARSFGDLSENAEYDQARNEQAKVEARIAELEYIILHTTVVAANDLDNKKVYLGSIVKVFDEEKKKEQVYSIVGSNEANPLEGKISDMSPVGSVLLGKHVGDTVTVITVNGERKLKILEISSDRKTD